MTNRMSSISAFLKKFLVGRQRPSHSPIAGAARIRQTDDIGTQSRLRKALAEFAGETMDERPAAVCRGGSIAG
jgi:hypothetical protein